MKVAGYVRVSTQEQVEKGWNLDADRELIRERCPEGAELELFDDGGLQGDDPTRPGLLALLSRLDEFDLVIMRQQDRISRDPVIWGTAASAFQRAGVRVETFSGPIDLDTPQGRFVADMMAAVGKLEKGQIAQRVSQAIGARARAGLHSGRAPYGYRFDDGALVVEPGEAEIVERIFRDYISGMGQRAIVRALNDDRVPTPHGGAWRQSAITKILNAVVYMGKIEHKGEILDGAHEPIVGEEVWRRAEAIRTDANRRKGGRHPDGSHLLTRGVLRCPVCESAMIPRKARPGMERERYVCSGRIADPSSCSQPSIRRELIDEPFLAHLLDGYIDLDATMKRIEERTASALTLAREALAQADRDLLGVNADARLAKIKRGWQEDVLDDEEYRAQRAEVEDERDAAQAALQRAQEHVQEVEEAGLVGDAEQLLLDHLAALKRAVAGAADAAPDLDAERNVIGQMFESVQLVSCRTAPDGSYVIEAPARATGEVLHLDDTDLAMADDGELVYVLWPTVRSDAVDQTTFTVIERELPVPSTRSDRPDTPPLSPSDNRTHMGSSEGTAGGSPRRSRTARPGRPRS